ncbi:hypothetical protein BO78DRAFT_327185 [Aspergillus sclerotiicarbonarius CBS 121057]|uniref:Zn(2)-C6 fungal-type domain-containing protein n=1 Tax=Aspergillus sclerotiicarbonarius (strain CBS 121057 / IBT 28362) TaxID=1448318 RepID=A0A319DV74_ASPSB|nr:hypothetical protein BO78DRAFT_327185 [Aspergillus sclerotiicarbonarius CBS 121057]
MNGIRKGITRRRGACEPCKSRKTRCDGGNPCTHCRRRSSLCCYSRARVPAGSLPTAYLPSPTSSWLEGVTDIQSRQSIPPRGCPDTVAPESLDLPAWELPDMAWDTCVDWSVDGSPLRDASGHDSGQAHGHFNSPAVSACPETQAGGTLSIHALQNELFNRQVTADFWLPSLYANQHVFGGGRHQIHTQKAVDILTSCIWEEARQSSRNCHEAPADLPLDRDPGVAVYIQACFESPLIGVASFLSKTCAHECVEEVVKSRGTDPATVSLVYSLLALGCYIVSIQSGTRDVVEGIGRATGYFRRALSELNSLGMCDATARTLQAFSFQTIFADKSGHCSKPRLLTLAVHCLQALGLHSSRRLGQFCTETTDERSLKAAFWFLYAAEKADAAYTGRFSIMDDHLADHSPSDELQPGNEAWLTLQCLYGRLCDRLIDTLYSQTALQTSRPEMCRRIESAYSLLQSWLDIFQTHRSAASPASGSSRLDEQAEAEAYLSYHFLTLLIHGKWLQLAQGGLDSDETEWFQRSQSRCVAAARAVLEQCSQQTHVELLASLRFLSLPKIAACILFLTSPSRGGRDEDCIYLRMACGFYSHLAIFMPIRLTPLLELVDLASQVSTDDRGMQPDICNGETMPGVSGQSADHRVFLHQTASE